MTIALSISSLVLLVLLSLYLGRARYAFGSNTSQSTIAVSKTLIELGLIAAISALCVSAYLFFHNYYGSIGFGFVQCILIILVLAVWAQFISSKLSSTRKNAKALNSTEQESAHSIEANAALEYLQLNTAEEKDTAELLENAIGLFDIEIKECIIPRNEIVAVEINEAVQTIKETFIDSKHSKLIVYENDIEKIVGYLHHSDFYKKDQQNINELIREIPTVPETMTALEMLTFFKKKQKSIAWVVDEFGGTSGILTTEDLLEELFGEIEDEHDESEYIEQQISADEFILSGRLEVEYINDKFDLSIPTESAETLSGYIIEVHNEIPEKDEKIIIAPYEYKILQVSKTRIETISLKIVEE